MESTSDPTLMDARSEYFARSGFAPDGGYSDDWVHIDMGRFTVKFPNTDARRRAVKYHDLHHVVTAYGTDLEGEAEISAWEIASGCRDMIAAWILNLLAFGHVLPRSPRRLFRAFVRGRRSRNLYGYEYSDALLARGVREMRAELELETDGPESAEAPRLGERLAFGAWGLLAFTLAWGPIVAPIALFVAWLA